jgi:hypothetical protein
VAPGDQRRTEGATCTLHRPPDFRPVELRLRQPCSRGQLIDAFDTIWFGDANFPLSEEVFAALLAGGRNHIVVMPTTLRKAQVVPQHEYAQYDNHLSRANATWRNVDPVELAQQVTSARAKWEFSSPWVFCNELSSSQWRATANEAYRVWAVSFAQALAQTGVVPVVYSPVMNPLSESDNWSALAAAAYVAIEGYLDPAAVLGAGDPTGYCRTSYASMAASYQAQGVPLDRCVLVEHYAQTAAGTGRGRGGLGLDDWLRVIGARVGGASAAGFSHLGSYAWGYNQMGVTDSEIVETAKAYTEATQ